MSEIELPVIEACACSTQQGPEQAHVADCCGGHDQQVQEHHDHSAGCCGGHDQHEPADAGIAALEQAYTEIAYLMTERFGQTAPTPEQEQEIVREWLTSKGRTPEEVDRILTLEVQDA
ncbi:MAG: hypothetical protein ACT4OM_03455 [Actinomycetota bacterium]